jgi:hypothetical protein
VDQDRKLRSMGWDEYGERLRRHGGGKDGGDGGGGEPDGGGDA